MTEQVTNDLYINSDLPEIWKPVDAAIIGITKLLLLVIGIVFVLLVMAEVFFRYVLDASIAFANPASQFLILWFFMLGAGLALRQNAHVGSDLVVRLLSTRWRIAAYLGAQFVAIGFLLQLFWGGYRAAGRAWPQIEASLGISLAWQTLAIPIGCAALIYHIIAAAVIQLRSAPTDT